MYKQITVTRKSKVTAKQKDAAVAWQVWDSATHTYEPPGSRKFPFDYAANHQEHVLVICGCPLPWALSSSSPLLRSERTALQLHTHGSSRHAAAPTSAVVVHNFPATYSTFDAVNCKIIDMRVGHADLPSAVHHGFVNRLP